MLDGIAAGYAARGHAQLAVDGTDMDSARAEHQLFSDLEVGQACCQQAQHLARDVPSTLNVVVLRQLVRDWRRV